MAWLFSVCGWSIAHRAFEMAGTEVRMGPAVSERVGERASEASEGGEAKEVKRRRRSERSGRCGMGRNGPDHRGAKLPGVASALGARGLVRSTEAMDRGRGSCRRIVSADRGRGSWV
jgi:hypothetical protein